MEIPELYTGQCATDGCTELAEIVDYCPGCAIERYRKHAVRPTPERWLRFYARPKCHHDRCSHYALDGQPGCRFH